MALNTFATVLGLLFCAGDDRTLSGPLKSRCTLSRRLFLIITGWTLTYVVIQRPIEALISAAVVGAAAPSPHSAPSAAVNAIAGARIEHAFGQRCIFSNARFIKLHKALPAAFSFC
ncbi:MAG: hypothetical protein CM15mP74_07210 [Halieaceae bacterium]|nr:MAG: hypothetical protein CM15mP74_07210 [Halieaceae bacterium]